MRFTYVNKGECVMVHILYGYKKGTASRYTEGIYTNKIQAERDARILSEQGDYTFIIETKITIDNDGSKD